MIIETKYNIGDYLFPISRGIKARSVLCGFCAGAGEITGASGKTRSCPDCYGRKTSVEHDHQQWLVGSMYQVRRIEANRCDQGMIDESPDWPDRYMRIIYMAGGSGTMWQEERLFPSRDEAQAECDRLNATNEPCAELETVL